MRRGRFRKLMSEYKNNDDIISQKRLAISLRIEYSEICFTLYILFAGLMYLFAFLTCLTVLMCLHSFILPSIFLVITVLFWFLADKYKGDFVMSNLGISFAEMIYDSCIREKYNMM